MINTLFSVFLLSYGSYGIWFNDLYIPIPSKHGHNTGIHLHDLSAWVMYGAFISASLVMLAVVFDHYDKRDNEINYKRIADLFRVIGWNFFSLSLMIAFIQFLQR
ncbi:hypothetical protein Hneap_2046 [Halothiobacillus neapolitanus c2]|uniref:Uncharacterized protein n=1 Tax=Halothiobacillus neapolitanus (strain ATCC 23641 / DSM 15147 / CIP 104769 / NCIMB 8539 / c2) TaxID=555778 RepID=D0KVN7_HALNC|nr:hypothetical protein Hneap_2046 [Halothiobacillus neapolitanus c2]OZB82052.1 MAG: hypothetical protein B7X28_04125 [Halothiobacillus sp. 13-55-253]TDN65023.1 hypothetical protein C8D83_10294 [Halothiobacillus neapolitanus]